MGSDELGIHSGGVDNRKAGNERYEGDAPHRGPSCASGGLAIGP